MSSLGRRPERSRRSSPDDWRIGGPGDLLEFPLKARSQRSASPAPNGSFKVMPTTADMDLSDIDLLLSGTEDSVNMIEVGARELPEATVLEAIKLGHAAIRDITGAINEIQGQLAQANPSSAMTQQTFR